MSIPEDKNVSGLIIKGNVTEVKPALLYFKINDTFRIYVDIAKNLLQFPFENDLVEIIRPKKFNRRTGLVIIGSETTCNFSRIHTVVNENLGLFYALKVNNVDEDEIISMDHLFRQLEPHFGESATSKCLINLLHNAPFDKKSVHEPSPKYKRSFKKCQIKLPSNLDYVNENSELYTFLKFDGMCFHNVYHSKSLEKVTDACAEYLFGILDVDPTLGSFLLSDGTAKVPIKFNATPDDLYKFRHKIVMLKKWTVFTEIFEEKNVSTLKYILVNARDCIIVECTENSNREKLFYRKNEMWDTGQRKLFFLQTFRISEVIYGYNKLPECWVEGLISEKDARSSSQRLVNVILTGRHISIVPFIKENVVYNLFYYQEPKTINIYLYKELYRLRNSKELYRISEDTIFQEIEEVPSPQNHLLLENFEDVEKFIRYTRQPQDSFSLSLTISKKILQDNSSAFASWFPIRHNGAPNFGTPGKNKQMRLIFWNPETNSYIDLYLIDRDNHITPLGLIDDMKVKIKHVQVYRNKYIKTTVFSSFEIMDYCFDVKFFSVNLSFSHISTWQWWKNTQKTVLGTYTCLPQNCIVYGSFILQALRSLKITPVCNLCKKLSVPGSPCKTCDTDDRDLIIEISICVQDFINSSFYMDTENKRFLFELLELNSDVEIKHFRNAFYRIGILDVNFCDIRDYQNCTTDYDSKEFLDKLVKIIKSRMNFKLHSLVDAVCIKQKEPGFIPWNIIEFRFM